MRPCAEPWVLRSASLAISGVQAGDLLVVTRAPDINSFDRNDADPMAFTRDGTPVNPTVRCPRITLSAEIRTGANTRLVL